MVSWQISRAGEGWVDVIDVAQVENIQTCFCYWCGLQKRMWCQRWQTKSWLEGKGALQWSCSFWLGWIWNQDPMNLCFIANNEEEQQFNLMHKVCEGKTCNVYACKLDTFWSEVEARCMTEDDSFMAPFGYDWAVQYSKFIRYRLNYSPTFEVQSNKSNPSIEFDFSESFSFFSIISILPFGFSSSINFEVKTSFESDLSSLNSFLSVPFQTIKLWRIRKSGAVISVNHFRCCTLIVSCWL